MANEFTFILHKNPGILLKIRKRNDAKRAKEKIIRIPLPKYNHC